MLWQWILRRWLLRPVDLFAGRMWARAELLLPAGGLWFRMLGRMRLPAIAVWLWVVRRRPLLLTVRPVL